MGTFIDMLGHVSVPKDKLPELTRRVLEIFTRGGMMELEELRLFGMRTLLLTSPELKNGELNVSYNYFEDDS